VGPNHLRIVLAYLRSVDAFARRRILFHGTSPEVGRKILSEGLIPDPKKRAWAEDPGAGFSMLPRTSFQGVYLTGNFMTAYSSSTNAAGPRRDHIIVVVDVEEASLVHDEDTLKGPLQRILYEFIPKGYVLTERGHLDTYDDMVRGKIDDKIREESIKFLKSIDQPASTGRGDQEERIQLVEKALRALIVRQAAYSLPQVTWYASEKTWEQMKAGKSDDWDLSALPEPKNTDKPFMDAFERLSNKLRPMHAKGDAAERFMDTSRIREPIGFSGSNRIVAIVSIEKKDWDKSGGNVLKFLYGNPSDPRLADFYKQYEQKIGDEYTVEGRGGKIVSEPMKTPSTQVVPKETPYV